MFHYGVEDAFIAAEKIDEVEAAVAGRSGVQFHRYAAGHAFSNWDAPSMYDEPAAELAWSRTIDFLREHLAS
jgi:carboxymethylenebutenolidase